ncbi:MAG TPA: wax ester/triacylglycerol synthase domain-containing protein [Microthrixaceae bacterium]|nr:wax ester/triacylglycerol synthase domain-containing protein [Microthrixaceae bacterium]
MGDREIHAERHMSDVESLMWNLDKDPRLANTIGNLTIFDQPLDRERFRTRLERAVEVVPRLHQRVVRGFGRLAPPEWRRDPDFDLDHHLRWISLGGEADRRDLYDAVMTIFGDPFDRARPLWEFTIIEGLGEGAAMLQRLHHTLMDGEGGLRISEQFVDFERSAVEPDAIEAPFIDDNSDEGLIGTLAGTAAHVTRRTLGATQRGAAQVATSLRHPTEAVHLGQQAVDLTGSALRQARVDRRQLSPLWTSRSLRRWFGTIDVSLDDVRTVAKRHGVSVNDVFVAGAARGAGRYHSDRGASVDALRMAMPVSRRRDGSAGGNMFGLTQTEVPTDGRDASQQLNTIGSLLARTKSDPAVGAFEGMAGLVNLLPTSVLIRSAFRLASSVDFTTSNLRAAPVDVFMGGSLIEATYPIGPLSGTAFNLTTMSYRGVLNMGLVVDAGAIDEPEHLRAAIETAFAELTAA